MSDKKVILLNHYLDDDCENVHDFTQCLPERIIKEFIEAGGRLYDLKDFGKNKSLRFDCRLIDLVEKYHEDIRRHENNFDYYTECLKDPRYKMRYEFILFRIGIVKTKERFAITQPYDDGGSKEVIVYFGDFNWLNLPV